MSIRLFLFTIVTLSSIFICTRAQTQTQSPAVVLTSNGQDISVNAGDVVPNVSQYPQFTQGASNIKVNSGYWLVYTQPNFQGMAFIVTTLDTRPQPPTPPMSPSQAFTGSQGPMPPMPQMPMSMGSQGMPMPMPQMPMGPQGPMPQMPMPPQGTMPPQGAMPQRPNIYSIRPLPYQGMALFSDSNFRSQVLYVNSNIDDLKEFSFNNITSSVIVISGDYALQGRTGQFMVSRFGGPLHDGTYPVAQTWGGVDNDVYKIIKLSPS